jgi:hypothetical protein
MSEGKPILFFDNEDSNWTGNMDKHSENVEFILVDDIRPNNLILDMIEGIPEKTRTTYSTKLNLSYIDYFQQLGNTYAKYLSDSFKSKNAKLIKKLKKDIPSNGIGNILENITPSTKYILLDWDRTVTTIDGMFFDNGLLELWKNGTIPLQHIIEYIMGGEERVTLIKHLFREVIERLNGNRDVEELGIKIPIFIITNNPNAGKTGKKSENRGLYIELIKDLFEVDDLNADNMLYSSEDYEHKKRISVCNSPLVSILIESCRGEPRVTISGGNQRKNKQRTKQNKKQTKRKNKTKKIY